MNVIYVKDFQLEAGHATIALKDPIYPAGPLTTQLMQILHIQADLAMPALRLLDFYFCLWDSYVVKSADKIHLDEEQQELHESNEWLEVVVRMVRAELRLAGLHHLYKELLGLLPVPFKQPCSR
ncbi:hypothetical protein N7507_004912 [Penicillium longicatenatum]|nr:hypothetical protein N7507_004912 [Penicillium longicatenatum]